MAARLQAAFRVAAPQAETRQEGHRLVAQAEGRRAVKPEESPGGRLPRAEALVAPRLPGAMPPEVLWRAAPVEAWQVELLPVAALRGALRVGRLAEQRQSPGVLPAAPSMNRARLTSTEANVST